MFLRYSFFILMIACFSACSVVKETSKQQMVSGIYKVSGYQSKRFYMLIEDTAFVLYPLNNTIKNEKLRLDTNSVFTLSQGKLISAKPITFSTKSFDFDVLTILFKYRPSVSGFPRQLNTNFNAAGFLGYRTDLYLLSYQKDPLNNYHKSINHFGYSFGFFGGLGATTMNPSVTDNIVPYEYDGLVITKGVTGLIGVGNLTFGLAAGFDHLMDKNRKVWLYQGKPWYGVTLGINLN